MKKMNLKLAVLFATMFAGGSAMAATATAPLNVTFSVANGCVFKQSSYTANFGTVTPGKVGKALITFNTACTDGIPYSITPAEDEVTATNTGEPVVITAYTTEARTTQITKTAPMLGAATGGNPSGTGTIYLRVNGTADKPNFGEGPVLTESQAVTGAFPIVITY